jgi:hypothetical protein
MPDSACLLACLLLAGAASLPAAQAQSLEGGLRIGGTLTTLSGDRAGEAFDFDWGTALTGGAGMRLRFPGGFAVGAQVAYVLNRASTEARLRDVNDPQEEGLPVDAEFELTYLSVPVLARYTLETRYRYHPTVAAGGYYARLNESRETIRTLTGDVIEEGNTEQFERNDYGLAAEAGVEIDAGGERLELILRYSHGLADVQRADTSEVFTRALSLSLGILF